MACCWISAYTVLPAALALAERRGWIRVRPEPARHRLVRAGVAEAAPARPGRWRLLLFAAAAAGRLALSHPPTRSRPTCGTWPAPTPSSIGRRAHGQVRPGLRPRHLRWLRAGRHPPRRGRAAGAQAAGRRRREARSSAALQPGDHARRPAARRSGRKAGGPRRAPRLVDRQLRQPDALTDADRKALRESRPPERPARARRRRRPAGAGLAVRRAGRHARADRPRQHRPRHRLLEHRRSASGSPPRCGSWASAPTCWSAAPRSSSRDMLDAMERDGPRATIDRRAGRRGGGRRACSAPPRPRPPRCSAAPSGRWRCSPWPGSSGSR